MRVVVLLMCIGHASALVGRGSSVVCDTMAVVVQQNGSLVQEYACSGSGSGVEAVLQDEVDFAASDSVATDPTLQMVPFTVSPIAIMYNVPGVTTLVLSREVLVGIFSGTVEYWDAPEVRFHNPAASLPHQRIIPVIRADKSGSTEIFTRSLHAFSPTLWPYSGTNTWPTTPPPAFATISGSTAVLDYLESTSFTISYSGMGPVAKRGIAFAVLKNQVGTPTLPGWADGDAAASGFTFDESTLVSNMNEGLGYPITGITYIVFKRGALHVCDVLEVIKLLLREPAVDSAVSRSGLVPVAAQTRNMAFAALELLTCDVFGRGVPVSGSEDEVLHAAGYLLGDSELFANVTTSDESWAQFTVGVLGLELAVNFGVDIPTVELRLSTIEKLVKKEISTWADPLLRERSSFLPVDPRPVVLVTDGSYSHFLPILSALNLSPDLRVDVTLPTPSDVAQYVKTHPGTVGFLPSPFVDSWHLSKVQPIVDGVPTLAHDATSSRDTTHPHPFFRQWQFSVPLDMQGANCRDHYTFASFFLGSGGQDILKSHGVLTNIDTKSVLQKTLATLTCNGSKIVTESEGVDVLILAVVGGVAGFLLFVVIICLVWHWQAEKRKRHRMLNANIYAAQHISEALVAFDLDGARDVLTRCVFLPSALQKAFTSLITNLESYKAYLPDSCLGGGEAEEIPISSPSLSTLNTPRNQDLGSDTASSTSNRDKVQQFSRSMRQRKISLAVLNVCGLHNAGSVDVTLFKYLSVVIKVAVDTGGVRDGFSGDKVYLSWNGARHCVGHVQSSARCVTMVCGVCEKEGTRLTAGLSTGSVTCDVMGTEKMKRFTLVGGVVPWVCAAERMNTVYETQVLTDSTEVRTYFYTYMLDIIVFPKLRREPFAIHALGKEKDVVNEEWMYQLQDSEANDPYFHYNRAMEEYFVGNATEAKECLLNLSDPPPRALSIISLINRGVGTKPVPTSSLPFAQF